MKLIRMDVMEIDFGNSIGLGISFHTNDQGHWRNSISVRKNEDANMVAEQLRALADSIDREAHKDFHK